MSTSETTSAARDLPLVGQVVGISISDSEDLCRRGFLPIHVDRALAEVVTLTAAAGARIGYGGHLEAGGFTHKLFRAVSELYGRRETATSTPPCVHYLAFPLWRDLPSGQLLDHVHALGGAVEVVLVGLDGHAFSLRLVDEPAGGPARLVRLTTRLPGRIDGSDLRDSPLYRCVRTWWSCVGIRPPIDPEPPRGSAESPRPAYGPEASSDDGHMVRSASELARLLDREPDPPKLSTTAIATAFSTMRLFMAADGDARVVLGGKTRGYSGHFPGIAEESLYCLLAGTPVVGLRCFGGCADDVVRALLSGALPDRPEVEPGNVTVLRALAAGTGIFRDALEQADLAAAYPEVAAIDSSRALAVGVLKCLERREWRLVWHRVADTFRSAVLSNPA